MIVQPWTSDPFERFSAENTLPSGTSRYVAEFYSSDSAEVLAGVPVLLDETETHTVLATLETVIETGDQNVCLLYLEYFPGGFSSGGSDCVPRADFEADGITTSIVSPNRDAAAAEREGQMKWLTWTPADEVVTSMNDPRAAR